MKRAFLALLFCTVLGVVILLSAGRPGRAGNNTESPTLFGVDQDAAADCCAKKGGELDIPSPYYNTNGNNPRSWVRLSGTRAFCKFTSLKRRIADSLSCPNWLQ
jgi:hypothetical protein